MTAAQDSYFRGIYDHLAGGGTLTPAQTAAPRVEAPRPPSRGVSVRDALLALHDAWDDPMALGDARLAVGALNCELTTGRQRLLLAVLLYELADAFTRATA